MTDNCKPKFTFNDKLPPMTKKMEVTDKVPLKQRNSIVDKPKKEKKKKKKKPKRCQMEGCKKEITYYCL